MHMTIKTRYKKVLLQAFLTVTTVAFSAHSQAAPSSLWQDFVDSQLNSTNPILPDFSYSGYQRSEVGIPDVSHTIFDVTSYGAIADDGLIDGPAIQAAIDAAELNGSGIITFPPGRFHLNTASDIGMPIIMNSGNIVWRGSGMGEGGTELFMEQNFEAANPSSLSSTPFMIQVAPPSTSEGTKATVSANAARGTFSLEVSSVSSLSVGDWITLRLDSIDAVNSFFGSYAPPDASWTDLSDDGIVVREKHQIKEISGTIITFEQPLQIDVDVTYPWQIRGYTTIEEVGFEDIAFVGNWQDSFVHHRSALDDGGWSAINLNRLVNSWIRRCRFTDWNYGFYMDSCSQFSVLHVIMDGNPGHHSMQSRRGYGVLIGLTDDDASHWHSNGVGYQSHSSVFWRCEYNSDSSFDSHSGQPYATLMDVVKGGLKYGRCGGPQDSLPNHMSKFTMWNFEHTGTAVSNYDFWRSGGNTRDRFLQPIVSGFHGSATTFNAANLEAYESAGTTVSPESLFEAQLELRLGSLPGWVQDAKDEWDVILAGTPTPTLTSPAKNSVHDPLMPITLTATVEPGDESLVERMEFRLGNTLIDQDTTNPYSIIWPAVAAGTYEVFARVVDNADGISSSPKSIIYVGSLPQPEIIPTAILASAEDGAHIAANVQDKDLGTRWSALGDNQWIRFDLGTIQPVNRLDISWFQGNVRTSDFEIEVSDDGSSWTQALSLEQSSGISLGLETSYFINGPARYVRIVGFGNSVNDWNSITEVEIFAPSTASSGLFDSWQIIGEHR